MDKVIDYHTLKKDVTLPKGVTLPQGSTISESKIVPMELKIGWYSGRHELAKEIELKNFDYIKLGPYIEELGGLKSPTTNQRLYEYSPLYSDYTIGTGWRDITNIFWK